MFLHFFESWGGCNSLLQNTCYVNQCYHPDFSEVVEGITVIIIIDQEEVTAIQLSKHIQRKAEIVQIMAV